MNEATELKALVNGFFAEKPSGFRPCAFYDDRLDCIRVIARDCSVVEERINDRLTVLVDNYHQAKGRKQFVGFTLKGARHFCQEHGLSLATSLRVTEILDALIAGSPSLVVQLVINHIARPLVQDEHIDTVEIPERLPQPA